MEMLNHINKRVKDQLSIKLPLVELLKLYRNTDTKPTVKNVSIIYVEMAFDHASPEVCTMYRLAFLFYTVACCVLLDCCQAFCPPFRPSPETAFVTPGIQQERAEVVPDLLAGTSKVRAEHQPILYRMAIKVILL
jgi:hypothetical protein